MTVEMTKACFLPHLPAIQVTIGITMKAVMMACTVANHAEAERKSVGTHSHVSQLLASE